MPDLIIIRLHPVNPTTRSAFTSYLTNLSISAFDLSFASSKTGVPIGTASVAWSAPSNNPLDPLLTDISGLVPRPAIFQHYSIVTIGFNQFVELEAVATAVIVLNPPAGHHEYQTSDLRLEITNNGRKVIDENLDFNIEIVNMPVLSDDPADYIQKKASVFVGLPDPVLGLDPTVAFVDMPANGQPPLFDDVVSAVNLVLAGDPASGATLANRSPLTVAQALQVAREIVWNRKLSPAPDPPRPLEEMYTRPPTNTGLNTQQADMDRKQFEASLTGFYATQEATAQRLAKYVFAASAAVAAHATSSTAIRVGFTFPVDPTAIAPGVNVKRAQVALINAGGFVLHFDVPAAYFYALCAGLSPNVSSGQRYRMATLQDEQQIIAQLQQALDDGVIKTPLPISIQNAARRMVALGSGDSTALPQTPLDADIDTLLTAVNGWLAFMGPDIDVFWAANNFPTGHLNLVLSAVTEQFTPLIAAIKAIPVNNVAALQARTTADWTNFFLPGNTALLPPFTAPGTPSERVAAFIRQLRKFFDVTNQAGPLVAATPGAIPTLDIATNDPIQDFISKYNAIAAPPFAFGSPINAAAFNQAVQQVFPGDPEAQAWLAQALTAIDELFQVTAGVPPPSMQFSYMEALYARGFTSKASITALSPADFQQALTGTVAYPVVIRIHTNAGNGAGPGKPAPGTFKPVNPDGSLVNCVPPWHLSPLGPVEYLHEMLLASAASTCDTPNPPGNNPPTIGTLITPRRGPLGSLHATAANVHTSLPLIDIVNENLEALADGSAAGVVYDTNGSQLAGHALKPAGPETPKEHHPDPYQHDPATIFAAIPEHSSPAAPVERPGAYAKLKSDFTAPALPYSQPLDIIRSYLHKLGASRFQTMRTFRENITEFVLNPALEPADFQKNLWRYPVRIDIAREYLGISSEEYDLLYTQDIVTVPTPGRLLLRELYGFNADNIDGKPWIDIVVQVPEFLKRTGLTYCEFLELQKSEFVTFKRSGKDPVFPDCEPCCAIDLVIQFVNPADPIQALKELAVFIRLWRTLRHVHNTRYSFTELRDICDVLNLFNGANINPDFIRQLAAFQMLRDDLKLSLGEKYGNPAGTGADRMPLLALWVGPAAANWTWAVDYLLGRIEDYAEAHHAREHGHGCPRHRSPEFMKIIAENLDALSSLAGFDPTTADTWFARPASTLRFAEVLTKIYLSDFTTGEILYLFTPNTHLDGDDPFPEQDPNEALDSPLNIPEDDHPFGLWALRRKLLSVEVSEEDEHKWTWHRIVRSLENEFGYVLSAGTDPLESLGHHFFPETLSAQGTHVSGTQRRYRTGLDPTKPGLWNVAPYGPFRYDTGHKELFTQLPLKDEEVVEKLNHIEELSATEQTAVQELYFAPRADLAPFAFLFANFTEAEHRLIEEENEAERWAYFRHAFALFYARCHVIANHLAEHISAATDRQHTDPDLAWALLRRLLADENRANPAPWEKDTGEPPAATLWAIPNGGAFAALTGLTGTGLLGTFQDNKVLVWEEVRGPMSAFGHARNEKNAPFPTILPAMNFTLPAAQLKFAIVRNGMATRDSDGEALGGAEGFHATWQGVLLVEEAGVYRFFAGSPTEPGAEPDAEIAERDRWRVSLQRGQKTWLLMNHHFPGEKAPSSHSEPLYLRRGAYFLTIEFQENQPVFDKEEHACHRRTGFQVKYQGPDTGEVIEALPIERLYRDIKTAPLEIPGDKTQPVANFLAQHYTSSLRDIRRTYQRAFKALLFAHRLDLSAKLFLRHSQSEIGFLLDQPDRFEGTSYFPAGDGNPYLSHHAYFNFNFLPVGDPYKPPAKAVDDRIDPSLKRRQAMFDWFERLYDYSVMRRDVRHRRERIAWLLFVEAESQQPPDPTALLLHLGVDLTHAGLLLEFYQGKTIDWSDLVDDRWATREWHADRAVRKLLENFVPVDITQAHPDLWASSDDASLALATANITKFYQDGCIENDDPRRYEDLKRLNDGLRERARAALLAYLCGMDRIGVPWGGFAKEPKDLSALLLLDVQVGICEKDSRIEEAISAVQAFVERARLGLEPTLAISKAFVFAWDRVFASFRVWQACKRRQIYKENWVEYLELEQARKTEAYRFLESELRRATLTAPVPGGMEYWPGEQLRRHPCLTELQKGEPSYIKQIPQPENLGLMGTPDRDGRPSWLAPSQQQAMIVPPPNPDGTPNTPAGTLLPAPAPGAGNPPVVVQPSSAGGLPLWIQSAIRLGTRFLRIAAAGEPMASGEFKPHVATEAVCCKDCCKVHPPVMDEYYFWLVDSEYYVEQTQDADWGKTAADQTSAWERPDQLPGLLAWTSKPMVRLAWCRVHNGEFQPPRKSDGGAHVLPGGKPELNFEGRTGDSLKFSITAADALPQGYADPSPWGFRYDMATDSAVVLPEVLAPPGPPSFPGGLEAYPFFAYFEPGAPLEPSIFNPALAVASFLRLHCRYEAAIKWYELYYKPLEDDNRWARCRDPQQPPPPDQPPPTDQLPTNTPPGDVGNPPPNLPSIGANQPPAEGGTPGVTHDGPPVSVIVVDTTDPANPCCQTEVVSELLVHQRAVLLLYLETLLQFGDAALCCCTNSPEAFQKARLIFDTMARILGPRPATIFSQDDGKNPQTVDAFKPRFAPLNPRLMELYDSVEERLSLIHHCMNKRRLRSGTLHKDMSYFGDDPVRGGWRTTESLCESEDDCCCPRSPYRFLYLVQKAEEITSDVRAFGGELLAAFEKGDAEYLAALRAGHECQLLVLNEDIRKNEWRDADWQVQALKKGKESAQAKRQYYAALIAAGLIANEQSYLNLTGVSMGMRAAGNVVEAVAEVMYLIPDPTVGAAGIASTPVSVFALPLGTKLAHSFSAAGKILLTVADITGTSASLSLTEAGWDRRLQDWQQQVTVLDIEIEQIERQILGAERRRDAALEQLNILQQQIEQAREVQDFLRDKFTSQALYLFFQQELAAMHRQMYELAWCAARQAQRAFNLERGHTTCQFLPRNGWDNLHEGLLAGEKLQVSLRQMEKSYLDQNVREYELTKHISLRLHFPLEFLRLKAVGACEIEIPEWMFDMDYPGHYMRRIKNVSVTIPCVVGPYTGVHCRLTLLSSATRIDPTLLDVKRCCHDDQRCCPDCKPGNGYREILSDPRIVHQYAATEAVATSSAQNDTGMFELNFRDERYLPFEYAGSVSRWRIELPPGTNQFDLESVSDWVLHLNYMAREGGDVLRAAACEAAACCLPGHGLRFFDVQQDFAESWQQLQGMIAASQYRPQLRLRMGQSMFPFLTGRRRVHVRRIELFFEADCPLPGRSHEVEFLPAHHLRHPHDEQCECEIQEFTCIASAEFPCLFHGVLDVHFDPLDCYGYTDVGVLRFSRHIGEIRRAFLVCHYRSSEPEGCQRELVACDH